MRDKICYMGDTSLAGAAAYLAGVMSHFGLAYDYVAGDTRPPADFRRRAYALYVLSDYPAANLAREDMEHIAARVRDGAGLLMIGGWESFHGRNGEYVDTPLAEAGLRTGKKRTEC